MPYDLTHLFLHILVGDYWMGRSGLIGVGMMRVSVCSFILCDFVGIFCQDFVRKGLRQFKKHCR
jgi:hypothetical protein